MNPAVIKIFLNSLSVTGVNIFTCFISALLTIGWVQGVAVTCTCTQKLISTMVHAMVVRFSYMWFMESATVSLIRQILLLTLDVQKPKSFQLQGGFAPCPPDQGLCPWTLLGAEPPDPRYRLALPRSP